MNNMITEKLKARYQPIVLVRSNNKPENALQLEAGLNGRCMMNYFSRVVVNGEVAVFDKDTCGCWGAVVAFGFGNGYLKAPVGPRFYSAFFSKGASVAENKAQYNGVIERVTGLTKDKFVYGERLHPSPERAYKWITQELPIYDFPEKYAILKPLSMLEEGEIPKSVIFTVNPLELSALIILSGSVTDGAIELVAPPAASGCQTFGNYVFAQEESSKPKAVLGLIDLSAKEHIREWIPDEYMTYSMTWPMFQQMEEAAKEGIFEGALWKHMK